MVIKLEVKGLRVNGVSAALHHKLAGGSEALISGTMLDADGEWIIQLNAEEDWDGPMEVRVTFSARG
ncbi:hypothetical protein [Shewanella sp. S1-49-MNA-CIBAN-0167]|uniref:hypothetical protein n=1 Tax=Shewanella sp. S1-49-MNA-CIBAN-0167 TaxID=3140468 RepID=UPI00331F123E